MKVRKFNYTNAFDLNEEFYLMILFMVKIYEAFSVYIKKKSPGIGRDYIM